MDASSILHGLLDELEGELSTVRNQFRGAFGRVDGVVAKLRQHADGVAVTLLHEAESDAGQLGTAALSEVKTDAAQAVPVVEQAVEQATADVAQDVTPTPSQPADPSSTAASSSSETPGASSPDSPAASSASSDPSTTSSSMPTIASDSAAPSA